MLPNGWELQPEADPLLAETCQRRFHKTSLRLALDPDCTLSLLKTQRGAPSGLATGEAAQQQVCSMCHPNLRFVHEYFP